MDNITVLPKTKWAVLLVSIFIFVAIGLQLLPPTTMISSDVRVERSSKPLGAYIKQQMRQDNIPGLAVVVIEQGVTTYKAGFGLADIASQLAVSPQTTFELASNTKAFTALALHKLEAKGLVKLSKPVRYYLPDFKMTYQGQDAPVTLEQLLHHTSGIGFESIALFEVADDAQALSRDVAKLNHFELAHPPGSRFEYATINYDVLGAVIAKVSGMSYERYVEQAVLLPLALTESSFGVTTKQATGYKNLFGSLEPFDAPKYRGNAPAGYLSSSINDVEHWLKLQLGAVNSKDFNPNILKRALEPNRRVKPSTNGGSYASGWWLMQKGHGEYHHSGSNPNFSSYLMFMPQEQKAIGILANINSDNVAAIADGIYNILHGKQPQPLEDDQYDTVDKVSSMLIYFMLPFALFNLVALFYAVVQTFKGQRKRQSSVAAASGTFSVALLLTAGLLVCISTLPAVFFGGVSWHVVLTWAPATLLWALIGVVVGVGLFSLYSAYTMVFQQPNEKQLFIVGALGALSGLGNTFCIFTINMALQSPDPFASQLYLIFLFGVVLYVAGQKLVRTKVLNLTNQKVFEMRMGLVKRILGAPYHQMEKVRRENLQAVLNNDSELISQFPHFLISLITSATTLLFCFVYLGSVNVWGLLLAVAVIGIAVVLFYITSHSAERHFDKARTIQECFFGFIHDLIGGLKELNLNRGKNEDFYHDMSQSGADYRDSNIQAGVKFVNVFVFGELLFTLVVGFVAFVYPQIFSNLSTADITTFVLVFLYMTGPVNGILDNIPQLLQIKVAWGRVVELTKTLDDMDNKQPPDIQSNDTYPALDISLKAVNYQYGGDNAGFGLGPVNCRFTRGQITFITGGNGSGKSTLAKLITGLYPPSSGQVNLNGAQIDETTLSQLYSAIFCDYHLFKTLYGVEHQAQTAQIRAYLEDLKLDGIVSVDQGKISTTELSTGQRKRLALLVSHLDERPVYLFDEWAADQDPQYRRVFYRQILPELKRQNKCVIVISHDDHYFDVADQMIKMDMGKAQVIQGEQLKAQSANPEPNLLQGA